MMGVLVFGAGGHAREVRLLCQQAGRPVFAFLDERDSMKGETISGIPVFQSVREARDHLEQRPGPITEVQALCAGVGDPRLKQRFLQLALEGGLVVADPVIHPGVTVDLSVEIGRGSVVCEGVTMTVDIRIGEHVIVNRNSTIGHDVTVADFVTLSPSVNVSGNVAVGTGVFVGTGASIRERVTIADWSLIGGGAFVAADVDAGQRVGGVPARPLPTAEGQPS